MRIALSSAAALLLAACSSGAPLSQAPHAQAPHPQAPQAKAAATEVAIDSGRLSGVASDGVIAFKGIPYAAPPVGDLRWRAPQPVAHWAGVRSGADYAHDCMQVPFPSDAAPLG